MSKISPTFCIYPWDHLATLTDGSIVPCCVAINDKTMNVRDTTFMQAWNSQKMRQMRADMLSGKPVKACNRCYEEESCGIVSHRVSSNTFYEHMLGSFDHLIDATAPDGHLSLAPKSIDLRLANNCNLQCVMCAPSESTKWAADIEKMYNNTDDPKLAEDFLWKTKIKTRDFLWYKDPDFWKQFKDMMPEIRDLIVGGGEPFLIVEQINFLKDCIKQGLSKHLSIRFHTNGTAFSDEILEILSHFRQIDLMISIDGFREQNHYVRYPANWNTLLTNLEKIDNTPASISAYILTTLHAMNIYYFPEFLKWFMDKRYKKISISSDNSNLPFTGIAHTPYYVNPRVLPKKIKESVRARFELLYKNDFPLFFKDEPELLDKAKKRFNANLDYMDAEDRSFEFAQFKSYVDTLDKTRKTNFKETFPELSEEIQSL